jgi:hypothetical protein
MNRFGLLLAGALCGLTGCLSSLLPPQVPRLQADDEAEKPAIRTVGDVSEFQTSGGIPVSGIGLVVELDGTGGGAPPGEYRRMAEEWLKKNKIDKPNEWLDSPTTALVLLSGEIPAGSRRHDRINVQVTLPPGSKVKSLRGGKLLPATLVSYATRSQVRQYAEKTSDAPPPVTGDGLLKGHVLAEVEGPLQVALKDKDNADKETEGTIENGVKRAWIWKGGRTKVDQPYYLVLNIDQQRYRMSMTIAERINETFHGPGATDKIAVARNADTVVLNIPPQYRGNTAHFLRVVRMIPIERVDENNAYRRRLEEQLRQPETALSAGLRLEALGPDSTKALTDAMKSSPYPLVRFAAAESLAYLGAPISANELARLTQNHPTLQGYCLTAPSSLDEAASSIALETLFAADEPEIRYGAFRAMRELDPGADSARGYRMNDSFWLHLVAPQSKPLVHLLSCNRAEIVLFGNTPKLMAPFSLRAGPDIVLTAKPGQQVCTISRFSARHNPRIEQCSLAVADIIKTMAEMGALYSDVAEMLMQARDIKSLNCELAVDALPKAVEIEKLAENAHVDKKMENEAELLKSSTADQAAPPNVFDRPR